MSSRLDKAIKDFIQIIREAGNKGTSPLDAQAEVLRIDEDGTAWVHLPGGVDETPVKLTINAEVGDKVYVRLSGGRAWITGNQTAPPTDDKTAITAKSLANLAGNRAKTAQKTADQAQIVADSALKGTKENAAQMAQMVLDFNGDIKNLQDQIDGNIATWFYDVDPDMGLPPVTDWDTDEKKDAHLGDIYYNTVKGYAWRFMKSGSTYSWERITDTDVTKALADAAKAQDTADSKRRVFYNTPTVPYDAGDLWVQGSGGDILRCAQAKTNTGSYDRNDWVLASKYTDDSALNTWIEGDFATTIQGLEEGLVDAKVETYYQTTDPSTGWSDTQKSEHKGDLWYNSTASVQKYYRWSGTAWQELTATPPQAVFDSIDKKATIYTGTTAPTNPSSGDLWFKGADEPILTYVNNSWVEYNKYTDDSTLNAWLTNTYAVDKTNLQNQIDGKAETWYQATDPSLDWSAADKPNHEGDLWYNTSDNTTWYYTGTAWSQQSIPTSVFNNINGKANIFVGSTTPENPKTGDLWLESASSDILTYVDGSWVKYNKYTDDTKAKQAIQDAANAATSATDYISPQSVSSTDDGIKVFPKSEKDNPKNYININSNSTDIYKNGKKIAQYSQGIIINDDDGNKVFSAELMNGKYINEHDSLGIHKKISAGVTTTLSFDLTVAPSGDIEGTIPVSNSFGELLGIMNVYSFIEAPQELSIPSEYGTGSVLVNSISYTNRTVTVSITNNTNIEIDFGTSAEYADHMIWSYYMRDYGVATRCGGFWENDYTKAFAIGVGKDTNNRKNAFAVDWDGNVAVNGNLVVQGDNLVSKIQNMFCAAYPETLTVKNGTFTNDGSNASLVGNSLYLHINAKANAAITAGNISNQTMLTITFTDDRILTLYSVSGSGGSSGPNSQMLFTGASSGGQHTITVTLAAIAQNIAKGGVINAKVSIPCVLNWDAYH